ncbi:MAG: hypothetical protein AB7J30_12560 [Hyphomicrobium sp.]|uniref:hypothetical protein n=1 Tax=Hyphomicrobium sp. TaxID=82 RepID=UPI003D140B98
MPRPRTAPSRRRRIAVDHGAPLVVAKRLALVGAGTSLRPADPNRAYYPLGVALERGFVTDEQHQAGIAYTRAFAVGLRRPLALGIASDQAEVSDERRAELTIAWRLYSAALAAMSRRIKDDTDNLVLYERWPLWLLPGHVEHEADQRHRKRVKLGLDVLIAVEPKIGLAIRETRERRGA